MLVITVNKPLPLLQTFIFLRAAIHSAVRVPTGEADEIAAQKIAVFAVESQSNQEDLKKAYRLERTGTPVSAALPVS
jgi:hypothetical protein